MSRSIRAVVSLTVIASLAGVLAAEPEFTKSERGVVVQTDRYRVEIADGVLVGLTNELTGEQYLYRRANLDAVLPHLPGGLGTQHGEDALAAAAKLYDIPWASHPADAKLPNQHYPAPDSEFELEQDSSTQATLTWTGLIDGHGGEFADESYALRVAVEEGTGDLMLTPSVKSPRPGVYAANVVIAPVDLGVTIEAPIWDGIRLTHDMPHRLWRNRWPSYWDHQFIALNGRETGAIGVWAADAELRYKDLFYLVNDEGIAVSLSSMNTPPFEKLIAAEGVTWHVQAFDHHWAQAAAAYRKWRDANRTFAERPDWALGISFVSNGVNAAPNWLGVLETFFDGRDLERTATFAATIRAANFDTMHYDNRPYEGFGEHMEAWHDVGAKLLAYLNPMTMWGREGGQHKRTEADTKIMEMAHASDTTRIFAGEEGVRHRFYSKHHLGYPPWREWFINWVDRYIQEYGAQGVYHDETYIAPVDNRGLINGMTPVQALADYFLTVNAHNPDSIHATEHLQEANLAGASLGIGAGVHWGTAESGMRMQRIRHPSAVSAALHYPYGVIWGFPHQSHIVSRRDAVKHHWGMDQRERRAQIPGFALQYQPLYRGQIAPYDKWENELRIDRVRALTFVRNGLRPLFPTDWAPNVLSYFRGVDGQEYRYEQTDWGTRFVTIDGGEPRMIYGRAHGVYSADTDAGIRNWAFYNEQGPGGLLPERYYCVWPDIERPKAYFSGQFTDAFVAGCYANDMLAVLDFEPNPTMHNIRGRFGISLHAPAEPVSATVDGRAANLRPRDDGTYSLGVSTESSVVVILEQPEPGIEAMQENAVMRAITDVNMDAFDSDWLSAEAMKPEPFKHGKEQLGGLGFSRYFQRPVRFARVQLLLPFRAPADGTLTIHRRSPKAPESVRRNGVDVTVGDGAITLKMKADETVVIELTDGGFRGLGFEWTPADAAE